jgi:hypothetical protein
MALESDFKNAFIKKLRNLYPGIMALRNDPNHIQGIPDWLFLWRDRWFALEFKRSKTAKKRPNQKFYVDLLGKMSYAAFVYPENENEVLDEIRRTLRS